MDASTDWGIAVVMSGHWRAWKLSNDWKADGCDIGWAESIALEFAVYHFIWAGFSHVRLLVHSDSQGAISQYNKGRGRNQPMNDCIHHSVAAMMDAHIDIIPEYVPSEDNLADGPSRRWNLDADSRLPLSFDTPIAISHLLSDV